MESWGDARAADGTLFLDEVADLSAEAQVKLLRFLDEGEYYRIGGTQKRTVKTRIVSATNRDLADEVEGLIGFWPGPPDDRLLAEWWIDVGTGLDLDSYLEQVERLDRYLDDVAEHVLSTASFRLLLAHHPTPDEVQHSSLIANQLQWAWSPGRELAAREGLKRVARSIDRSVASMWRTLDPGRDVLESEGIFLNYVNHADIRYGGGKVSVNGILSVYTPIHMIEARPTVSFNTITNSAVAAISADLRDARQADVHRPVPEPPMERVAGIDAPRLPRVEVGEERRAHLIESRRAHRGLSSRPAS